MELADLIYIYAHHAQSLCKQAAFRASEKLDLGTGSKTKLEQHKYIKPALEEEVIINPGNPTQSETSNRTEDNGVEMDDPEQPDTNPVLGSGVDEHGFSIMRGDDFDESDVPTVTPRAIAPLPQRTLRRRR